MKLTWERIDDKQGHWLRATHLGNTLQTRELDEHIAAIVRWSQLTKCGQRMAYDMWQFREESHMTQFLLTWS